MSQRPGRPIQTVKMNTGCYNCRNWDPAAGRVLWEKTLRLRDLAHAATMALESPQGEADPRVVSTIKNVDAIDHAMVSQKTPIYGTCAVKDAPRDKPLGDLVSYGYFCDHWSGAQGASVAREGEKLGKTSDELMSEVFEEAEKGAK